MHLSNNLVLKRVIIFYIFLNFTGAITATDYYISSSGDDIKNNGLTASTPWKTIGKVNSVFSSLKAGDRILFKCADVFYGTLNLSRSGVEGNPIIIGSYGTGGKPVITGFTTVSMWTNEGDGIYSAPVKCESPPEMVTINGKQYAMGRWPNSEVWPKQQTWASIDTFNDVSSITDSELNSTEINWTGVELVIRNSTRNRISRYNITNHSGNTLTFSGGNTSYPLGVGWGYFIQNDKRTLDQFGEWYYDSKTSVFYMYFGSETPDYQLINVTTLNYLISFNSGTTNCNINNIAFYGANNTAINGMGYNHNNIIDNCDINSCGYSGIYFWGSQNLMVKNCLIDFCNDNAICITDKCENTYIGNNELSNIGLFPGLGQGLWASGKGLYLRGNNNAIVEYNKIINSGFSGIHFSGNNVIVRYNFIDNFNVIKEDGGGIQYGGASTYSNLKILNNLVINGLGSSGGKPSLSISWTAGIYLDYYTLGGVEISSNTVANVSNMGGILISGSQNVILKNNTTFNCSPGIRMQELGELGSPPRNITMNSNILFAALPSFTLLSLYSTKDDFDLFGSFDYNYYARPLDNLKPILIGVSGNVTLRSLTELQTKYYHDVNSNISPITLKDTADIDFYYNATKSAKTIILARPMIDVKGDKYYNSVTLEPYTSVILMVDPEPEVPVPPAYKSSVIQDSAPDRIEISFNVTLGTTSTAPDAFTVKVNGIICKVKDVLISDNKITLILDNPVKFGDNITFSYTQPETNKLQSAKGSFAESIPEQIVKNNIIDPVISNRPPVISIIYEPYFFSGFVYEIDASGTTDPDNDSITYTWKVPASIPVSGTNGSKIRFLAPVVKIQESAIFTLTADDGIVTVDKTIEINLLPYKPEISILNICGVSCSNYFQSYYAENAADANPLTRWSAEGTDQWLMVNLPVPCKISHLQVAFLTEQKYESYFDIYASKDNIIWEPVSLKNVSCDFSGNWQIFNFPDIENSRWYSYIKLVCNGNSIDGWNNISGLKIFGSDNENDSKSYYNSGLIELYPNPVSRLIKVLISEPSSTSQALMIYNSSGALCMEEILDPGVDYFQFAVALKPGIYIAKIVQSGLIAHTQKLIVIKG